MAILVDEVRAEWSKGRSRSRARSSPSLREVCLMGVARLGPDWKRGDKVTFLGRAYCVEAAQIQAGRGDEALSYVHLSGDEEAG